MKYYWWGAAALVAIGLYLAMTVSIQPQSIPKITFSQVVKPADLGKGIAQRMVVEVHDAPVLFLGVTPNSIEDIEMWKGFLEANNQKGLHYDTVIVEGDLAFVEAIPYNVNINLRKEEDRFVTGVKKALSEGLRVAVIVPTIYSSQLLKGSMVNHLKSTYQLDITSFSISRFPTSEEQEIHFEPRCAMEESQDSDGTGALGCMIRGMARKTYRKKLEAGKFSGLMEQTGEKDYVVLFNKN